MDISLVIKIILLHTLSWTFSQSKGSALLSRTHNCSDEPTTFYHRYSIRKWNLTQTKAECHGVSSCTQDKVPCTLWMQDLAYMERFIEEKSLQKEQASLHSTSEINISNNKGKINLHVLMRSMSLFNPLGLRDLEQTDENLSFKELSNFTIPLEYVVLGESVVRSTGPEDSQNELVCGNETNCRNNHFVKAAHFLRFIWGMESMDAKFKVGFFSSWIVGEISFEGALRWTIEGLDEHLAHFRYMQSALCKCRNMLVGSRRETIHSNNTGVKEVEKIDQSCYKILGVKEGYQDYLSTVNCQCFQG